MATRLDTEFESSFDREILHELEGEFEGGAHLEDELAMSMEGGVLHEYEFEGEFEGEQFFGRVFRGIGRFVRRAAPILRSIAKVAAPIVGTAVGGPLGGMIARTATGLLGEGELEDELAAHESHLESTLHEGHPEAILHELEGHPESALHEGHLESTLHEGHPESILHELEGHPEHTMHESVLHEFEGHPEHTMHESVLHELEGHPEHTMHEGHPEHAHQEALAEMMAEVAAGAHMEAEAEAMAGAAVVTTLSPRDRAALRRLLPHLVRGAAVLTRILRRRRITRPAVRTVPLIVRQTARTLRRQAAAGTPVTRRTAGRVMARVTQQVLGNPRVCALAIGRNVRASRRAGQGIRSVRG